MGTTEILARHIVETTYDSLGPEVVRAAKDERLTKFRRTAGVLLDPGRVARAEALIERLETLPSLRELLGVMGQPA